jgi:hypothetical protein
VFDSITKLMGESFKLHSHALTGYEDALMNDAPTETPQPLPATHGAEVAAF